MNPWLVALAALSGAAGVWLLYLASPQQQWRVQGPRRSGWPGVLCLLLSLALAWPLMGALEAVAAWLALAMLAASLAPFAGAWRARRRGGAR